jgi:RecB family exonuclease
VWSGPPGGIRSHAELAQIADLRAFVAKHVRDALRDKLTASVREQMPRRYMQLEEARLADLVTQWLLYERKRVEFTVEDTELKAQASIHGLRLDLRLDRVDRLSDGTLLVIDYKTGDVSPKSWEMPRPDDVQLPLYAGFALDRESQPLGGLVFAKVRAGQHGFAGRVADAQGALMHDLGNQSTLVKKPFTVEELIDWRDYIEKMAADFIAGHAEVDPRDYPKTCENCGLEALCRVRENRGLADDSEDGAEVESE